MQSNGVGGAGLTNLKVFDGGVGINLTERLGIDVNAYRFIYDAAVANDETSAGTEYDLIVSWKHVTNMKASASITIQVISFCSNSIIYSLSTCMKIASRCSM